MQTIMIGIVGFIILVGGLALGAVAFNRAREKLLHAQFRSRHPEKVALLAYSQNEKWSAYFRDNVVPRIGQSCLVVNRSDAQWKSKDTLAASIVDHFGGRSAHNPLAVLFPKSGRPRVCRLYHAFRQNLKGKPHDLQAAINSLERAVHEELRRVG